MLGYLGLVVAASSMATSFGCQLRGHIFLNTNISMDISIDVSIKIYMYMFGSGSGFGARPFCALWIMVPLILCQG